MLSSLSTTGKNLLRSAEHFSLLVTHTTASSVGGFLSSLPPSHWASNWNVFIALLIYNSSSLQCKEGALLLSYKWRQWSLSSFCKELAGRRTFGVRRNRKAETQNDFGVIQQKKSSLWLLLIWHNQTTQANKKTPADSDFCKTTQLVSVRNRVLTPESKERPPEQEHVTWYSSHLIPL